MRKDTKAWAGLPAMSGLVVAALMLTPAMSQANTEDTTQSAETSSTTSTSMSGVQFDELDQDGDGALSQDEFEADQSLTAVYEEIDSDGDGQITRTEFAAIEGSASGSATTESDWETSSSESATTESEGEWDTESESATTQSESEWDTESESATAQSESEWDTESESTAQSSSQKSEELQKLVDEEGQLSKFVEAVEAAGMAEALTSGTNYTIFAPTDDAFEASGQDLQSLMEQGNQEELVNVLRAHIVADDVDPDMAKRIGKAKTIGGGEVELTSEGDTLKVGGNDVVTSDIQQGNLRVYAIDGVLEAGEPMDVATTSEESEQTSSTEPYASESSSSQSAMSEMDFDELDTDGDGYLSEQELQAQQELADQQQQLDSDSDGRVSRTEFAAFEQGSTMPSSESASEMPPHSEGESEWETEEPSEESSDWQTDDQQ